MGLHTFVSVLEFELRKAQDTIKSLRATLTKTAGKETKPRIGAKLNVTTFNVS